MNEHVRRTFIRVLSVMLADV